MTEEAKPIRFRVVQIDSDNRALVEDEEGDLIGVPLEQAALLERMTQLTEDMDRLRRAVVRLTHRAEVI